MSGIAAIYYRDGRPASRDEIERVARTLRVYGSERLVVRVEGSVAFAYAHFTDSPESRGSYQPLLGGGGRYIMVFDGRLDNRGDVARELGICSSDVRLLSDAQLAMKSWERWGSSSFGKWVGEYSLINWDKNESCLTAGRDQFGRRTLHYHEKPHRIVLASAPKCIHALGDVPREIDDQKIADALSQIYHNGERTFFKDIKRVPPACVMTVERGKSNIRQYYDFRENIREVRYKCDQDYVEAARELFQECVEASLRSPGQVGAFMSGGLDSSTMAIFAARILERQGKRLPTFTSVPEPGWDQRTHKRAYGDETPYVRAIAEKYPSIELNLVDTAGLGHYHKQEELLHALDMPVRNALNLHWTHGILEQAKDHGIKVMLQGVQGNATLSYAGDGIFMDLLRRGALRQLLKELVLVGRGPLGIMRSSLNRLVFPLGPTWLWDFKEQLRGRPTTANRWSLFSTAEPSFADQMHIPQQAREVGIFYRDKPRPFGRDNWIYLVTSLASDTGDIMQGLRALYGIDIRDPFADRRLIEWAFGVPENQFYRNGVGRWLIKRMMHGVLPDSVLYKKISFGMQTADWHVRMTRDLPQMRKDLAQMSKDPDLAQMIDIGKLQKLLDDWPENTVVDLDDERFYLLPVNVPLTMQVARFVQRVKGVNLRQ